MHENNQGGHSAPLADCPYCGGEGTDPADALGHCRRCYGTGRVARFLAERTLERWAKQDGTGDDGRERIEDEVPPGYTAVRRQARRRPEDGRPQSRAH